MIQIQSNQNWIWISIGFESVLDLNQHWIWISIGFESVLDLNVKNADSWLLLWYGKESHITDSTSSHERENQRGELNTINGFFLLSFFLFFLSSSSSIFYLVFSLFWFSFTCFLLAFSLSSASFFFFFFFCFLLLLLLLLLLLCCWRWWSLYFFQGLPWFTFAHNLNTNRWKKRGLKTESVLPWLESRFQVSLSSDSLSFFFLFWFSFFFPLFWFPLFSFSLLSLLILFWFSLLSLLIPFLLLSLLIPFLSSSSFVSILCCNQSQLLELVGWIDGDSWYGNEWWLYFMSHCIKRELNRIEWLSVVNGWVRSGGRTEEREGKNRRMRERKERSKHECEGAKESRECNNEANQRSGGRESMWVCHRSEAVTW